MDNSRVPRRDSTRRVGPSPSRSLPSTPGSRPTAASERVSPPPRVFGTPSDPGCRNVGHGEGDARSVTPACHTGPMDALSTADEALERTIVALAGPNAIPRDDQRAAVRALVDDRARVLVVQATGWGKSAVYWAATTAIRERGGGCTLVVSPLLALMRDQIAAAAGAGLRAATVNSTNVDEWSRRARRRRRRSRRRPAGVTGAARQPPLRRAASRADRPLRAARHRRGPLRVGLGFRLPARLPAAHPHADVARAGHARAGHHRHGQRPGHRDVAAQLGAAHGDAARLARPGVAPPRRRPRARSRRPLRLGRRRPRRPRRLGDRLRAHRRRDRAGGRAACRARVTTSPPTRRRSPRTSASTRGRGCAPTRSRRSSPPRRSAWATTSRTWRSASTSGRRRPRSPTTSRSVGPGGRSTTRSRCSSRRANDERIWEYFATSGIPEPAHVDAHPRRPRRRGHDAPDARDRDRLRRGRIEALLKILAVDDVVVPRPGRLAAHRHAVGVRRGEVAVAAHGCVPPRPT